MKENVFKACLSVFLISLWACHGKLHDYAVLTDAERLIESYPDSTLILLESMRHPEHLKKKQQAVYCLLQTAAKDKTNKDVSDDELLEAIDYFEKEKNYDRAAYACFYQNRIFEAQNQIEQAIKYCCISKKYAEKVQNLYLLGMIHYDLGCLYKERYNFEEALENLKESLTNFLKVDNKKYVIYIYKTIGDIYLITNQKNDNDSALIYYQKAWEYLKHEDEQKDFYDIYLSISLNLCEANLLEDAKKFGKQAEKIADNTQTNINLSGIYISLNKPDSALFFLNKAHSINKKLDLKEKYVYKKILYRINYIKQDYQTTISNIEDCLTYKDSIHNEIIQKNILEIQKKYEKESLENERNGLLIERLYYIILCLFLTLSICIIVMFFKYQNNKQKLELLKAQQNLKLLTGMIQNQSKNEDQLRQFFIEKLDIVKKITQMNSRQYQNNDLFIKQYYNIFGHNIAENLNWDNNLYAIFNGLYKNFVDRIKDQHPILTEKELQLCCLVKANFSKDEIGLLLSYEPDSIKTIRSRIGKKLGFSNNDNFTNYIINL